MKNRASILACTLVILPLTVHLSFAQSTYEPYTFTTLAGLSGFGSADGLGSAARFNDPTGVAVDSMGNVYVADFRNHTIRKVTPSGLVSTLAGSAGAPSINDGTGSAAGFNYPMGLAADNTGNVYVADYGNHLIRKITPSGEVSALAGLAGESGSEDGRGGEARFSYPIGVAVDSTVNVYVADFENHTIRKITPSGEVSTLAGLAGASGSEDGTGSQARFNGPIGMAVDSVGNVYVADYGNQIIRKITPSGEVSTLAGLAGVSGSANGTGRAVRFYFPYGVAVDSARSLYVADLFNHTIRKITAAGEVSTLAGLAGSLGSADGSGVGARFSFPHGVAVDSSGNVYVADSRNLTIRKITPGGEVSTLAGVAGAGTGSANGTGSVARFNGPWGIATDSTANVYAADSGNYVIRKITPDGNVSTLAGSPGSRGSVDGAGSAARFNNPLGVAVDGAGNVYVADNATIRKITPGGLVSTLAGSPGSTGSVDGTGSVARFNDLHGVAVDSAGNVFVADNATIRKITPGGLVSTLAGSPGTTGNVDGTGSAARFNDPRGVAVDGAGNVFVAGFSTIRKITPAGVVSTVAGLAGTIGNADGTGSAARFAIPQGVAVDNVGNLFIADMDIQTIRKITPGGVVSTLAGSSWRTGSEDGTGSAARFYNPRGVAVDGAGNVYVADTGNSTIRKGVPIPRPSPIITTQPQTQTLSPGANVTFSVSATGAEPMSFKWSKNGVDIPGATNATLILSNVQAADAGVYSVIVSNAAGSVTSADAAMTVTQFEQNLVINGSFEATSPAVDANDYDNRLDPTTGVPGWTTAVTESFEVWSNTLLGIPASLGTNQLEINARSDDQVVTQMVSGLNTNCAATFCFDYTGRFGLAGQAYNNDFTVTLRGGYSLSATLNPATYSVGGWTNYCTAFVPSSSTITIEFRGKPHFSNGIETQGGAHIDNVSLTQYCPPTPGIHVSGNSATVLDGDTTPSLSDHTDFGSVLVSNGTVARTFTIANSGAAALNLTGSPKVAVSGANPADFTVTQQPSSPVASLASTTTFTVTFDPSASGLRMATLRIANDDSDANPYDFAIQGNGLASAAPGDVDLGFNPNANGGILSSAVQPDGKIVVGGFFSTVGGATRYNIARLNADGTLDTSFDPSPNTAVYTTAVQPDGKIVLGGAFDNVGGVSRVYLARLNADGTLDTRFNPNANHTRLNPNSDTYVYNMAVQADGKIVIGGLFTTVGGMSRNYVARLNPDGTLDMSFDPSANYYVFSLAVQADEKIVIGGGFSFVAGAQRNTLARLNPDGTLDTSFNPNVAAFVYSIVLQADGKILIGGDFSTDGGLTRNGLARLNADGTLDASFNPSVNVRVESIGLQADGKIVLGGNFTNVNGVTRNNLARLNADGTLDARFDPNANVGVYGLELQADGKIVLGGRFTSVGGVPRSYLARLENDTAIQSLTVPNASRMRWLRSGSAPETQHVTFELSINGGSTWTMLGAGARIPGGWELTGLSLPSSGLVRAQARTTGGVYNGSSGLVETVAEFVTTPTLANAPTIAVDGQLPQGDELVRRGSATITIETAFPVGAILYTLDGSEPSLASTLYEGSFILSLSASLRVVTYNPDFSQQFQTGPLAVVILPKLTASAGGGSVAVEPPDGPYFTNSMATVTATPASGWTFLHWLGDANGTNPVVSVQMTRDKSLEAVFGTAVRTAVVGNGSIWQSPIATLYPYGSLIRFSGLGAAGSYLSFWGNAANSTDSPLDFFVTSATPTVTAVFQPLSSGQFALALVADGGGDVAASPQANRYDNGAIVQLTAIPEPGQEFIGWSGDANGVQKTLTVTMNTNRFIAANFTKRPRMEAGPGTVGWADEGLRLTLTGELGGHYEIQASMNLANWVPLAMVTNTYGTVQFIDRAATNLQQRFYRAVAILAGVTQAGAANLVANGSFEHGTPVFNLADPRRQLFVGSTAVTGWTLVETGPGQFFWWNGSHPTWAGTYASPSSDGNLYLYFNGSFNHSSPRGKITTSVVFPSPGNYRLEFDMWSEPSVFGSREAGFTSDLAGLASYTDHFAPAFSPNGILPTQTAANWRHIGHDFAVSTPGAYALSFTDASTYGDPAVSLIAGVTPSPFLDNVSITAIPDPPLPDDDADGISEPQR